LTASRENAVDVAFALERFPFVRAVLVLDLRGATAGHGDRFELVVVLAPYTPTHVVQAHYALLAAVEREACRVLYVDSDATPPAPLLRALPVIISPHEREVARARIAEHGLHYSREIALEEAMVQKLLALDAGSQPVAFSLESGEFEVVADPFPSPKLPPPRVLVVDADDACAAALRRALDDIEVVDESDGWRALTRLEEESFDLVLCALAFGEWTGPKLYRMVAAARPGAAARIVFVTKTASLPDTPPASARDRVLRAPVDPSAVRALVTQWRRTLIEEWNRRS
jgi:CheY-like chemotaxis protein